ncbi:MAG: nitrous oxide-stimulated promoter family protein [Geobacter sp.]|nr:nitrous oxide-stimulated promoter family protein [Geobacter sp.]
MEQFTSQQIKDMKILASFVRVYCKAKHASVDPVSVELPEALAASFRKGLSLCPNCAGMIAYALERRRKCPLDPKPSCKHCRIHCYSKEYRAKIKEIMGFSGRRMIFRGRLDYLWHYFF